MLFSIVRSTLTSAIVVHAKGLLLSGTFTPTSTASTLSSAPHFAAPSTPVTVRFSNSTGVPQIPDTEGNADPRGIGIRFHLGGRKHTDFIAHSTPFFPTRTGTGFLELFKSLIAGTVGEFLGKTPSALAFVQAPKPPPASFATEKYFGVTALKFVSKDGKEQYFRLQVAPDEGVATLDEEAIKGKGPDYLFDEVKTRVVSKPFTYKLLAQLAEEGDQTDDATVHWPESRKVVELGSVKVEKVVEESEQAAEQKKIILDPIPRVEGLEPSADPLLEFRAALYLISGRQRRAA